MFLSRTGVGGLETRLTEAIGNGAASLLRYKSELLKSLKETLGCERCCKIFRLEKKLTVLHVSTETVNRHAPLSFQ